MATAVGSTIRPTVEQVVVDAYRRAFDIPTPSLAGFLAHHLGRPTVARLTGAASPNSVTKWKLNKAEPERHRVERMREAAWVFHALVGVGLSEVNAEQWFRGKNPTLDFRMPVDVLAEGDVRSVIDAVRNHASE